MGAFHTSEMFDRTPVLFRSGGNFPDIGQNPIRVCAVLTVDLFNQVQVLEVVPVESQVVPSPDIRDPVKREADPLIKTANQIQKGDGDQAGINDRGGQ
jgi:hypothetical protein